MGLDDLCRQLFEMVQYKNYYAELSPPYPLDQEAAAWVREYAEPRGIVDKRGGISVDQSPFYKPDASVTPARRSPRVRLKLSETRPRPFIRILTPQNIESRIDSSKKIGGLTAYACDGRGLLTANIILPQHVLREVIHHLREDTSRESGGLFLGYELCCNLSELPTTIIVSSRRAKYTEASPTRLSFTNETWRDLDEATDKFEALGQPLQRLGWYHSHIGCGIFLSGHDLDVCRIFESRRYPIAFVFDPVKNQAAFFVRGSTTYNPQGFCELHDVQTQSIVDWTNAGKVK